jgi:hypothetical protein
VSAPDPEPSYSPTPAAEAPAVTQPAVRQAKPKAKKDSRISKRKLAAAPTPRVAVLEPALPVVNLVEERRLFAPPPAFSSADDGSSAPYLLALLAVAGALLLGLAGAAPRLAFYWPEVFVPVIRGRETVSFAGLCLVASSALAWVIAGAGS